MVGRNKILARASQVSKEGEESDYPAYGVTGPAKEVEMRKIFLVMFWLFASLAILLSCTSHLSQASPARDRKLAQSAQMYHYQVKRILLVVVLQLMLLLMMIMKMIMAMMMRAMMTRMRTMAIKSTTTMCSTRRTR